MEQTGRAAKNPFLECGKIVNTHGVRGTVKAESWCDSPAVLAGLPCVYIRKSGKYEPFRVTQASRQKEMVLLTLEGVTDMDAAAALKETVLYAARADLPLPKDGYFLSDALGLPVLDAVTGVRYGEIIDVSNRGGRELFEVKTPGGVRFLPAVPAFVVRVDAEEGLFVNAIPGLFDDAYESV